MKIYTLYIEDDRYSVPTLLTAEHSHDGGVMEYVGDLLGGSQHYLAADIWDGDRKVGRIERRDDLS